MERNINLNTINGWEAIINENATQKAQERMISYKVEQERRLRKLWLTACGIAVLGVTYVILGVTGAVANWLASVVAVGSIAGSSFGFGRYVETKKG